jgi:hypothetical protein
MVDRPSDHVSVSGTLDRPWGTRDCTVATGTTPLKTLGLIEMTTITDKIIEVRRTTACVVALAAGLALAGCTESGDPPAESETETSDSESESMSGSVTESDGSTGDEEVIGWVDVGFGETTFAPIEDGGEMHIVWGSQGAAMFPMPIRGAEFTLPDDPADFTDERAPMMDLTVDIDGFNDGVGGHFKRIANYPVAFSVLGDGTYEFIYVRVIVPDTIDPMDLDGRPAHLWVQVDPYDSAPLVVEYDLTVRVDPPPF